MRDFIRSDKSVLSRVGARGWGSIQVNGVENIFAGWPTQSSCPTDACMAPRLRGDDGVEVATRNSSRLLSRAGNVA